MTQRSFLSLVFALLSLAASAAENLFPVDTRRLLREHPEITTWLYGDTERSEGKFAFRRTCNLECRVGVVETEPFVAQYKSQRTRDYIMLQGHPAMWSDESFESFKRILDCLEADGWIFTTHSGYQKAIK